MQERDAHGYPKVAAFLKHFTAYSTETNRGHDTYDISAHDLFDTYLPQYELGVRAGPFGVMCSYNGINGQPSCASGWLLNDILRAWAPHAIVTSDCGVVGLLTGPPVNAPDDTHAAAYALMNGTDLEMGFDTFKNLPNAIQQGLATEARLDEAVRRLFRMHFLVGRFDPLGSSEWTALGREAINSSRHQQVSYEAALQSLVLLKNDRALPLVAGRRIAVLGPQAVTRFGLLSNYAVDHICVNGSYSCIHTVAEAIEAVNIGGSTVVQKGVDVGGNVTAGEQPALDAAAGADVVVLVLGIDRYVEHEALDRTDTALPGLQEAFALSVLALNKPVVLVLTNGGALAIDALVNRSGSAPYAIIEAFNPATSGARALAASLFGKENRWGKLPITMYPHSFIHEKAMTDYDMSSGVGRTYRYYKGAPLFPFGSGLSLTTFSMSCVQVSRTTSQRFECTVRNLGALDGDEVVLVYHVAANIGAVDHPVPQRSLIDFARVSCRAGAVASVGFDVELEQMKLVNGAGRRTLYPGTHRLVFSRGHGDEVSFDIAVEPPATILA